MRRECKQSAAGTPFEDSGRATRATQPEIPAVTRHQAIALMAFDPEQEAVMQWTTT